MPVLLSRAAELSVNYHQGALGVVALEPIGSKNGRRFRVGRFDLEGRLCCAYCRFPVVAPVKDHGL